MRYTITIKDNENSKITKEIKANAIIIGFANGENCGNLKVLDATNIEVVGAILSTKEAIKDITSKYCQTGKLVEIAEKFGQMEKVDD